jgi:hypothetical protein
MDASQPRRFQFGLRALMLAFVPVAIVALPLGYYVRRPKPIPVRGSVTLDGARLDNAYVVFESTVETPKLGWAIDLSDAKGRFALSHGPGV